MQGNFRRTRDLFFPFVMLRQLHLSSKPPAMSRSRESDECDTHESAKGTRCIREVQRPRKIILQNFCRHAPLAKPRKTPRSLAKPHGDGIARRRRHIEPSSSARMSRGWPEILAERLRVECGDLSPLWLVAERRWDLTCSALSCPPCTGYTGKWEANEAQRNIGNDRRETPRGFVRAQRAGAVPPVYSGERP